MAKSNFIVRGGADFSAIKNEMKKTQKQFKGFQATLSGALKLAGITLGIEALVDFGKKAIGVASDLIEVQNVVDVTFSSMAKDINEFSKTSLEQFGLSELSAKKYSSTMGAMLKSSGITGEAVKDMSIDLTKLSADMASFYNKGNEAMFQKIMSGMSGMTMPLKELGINMNIANLEAYALAQGISKPFREMSQAEQTLTRYNYLLSVTKDSQGDFARNTGTWANQVKILKEKWQEFMSLIGSGLIKILLPIVKLLNKVLDFLIKIGREISNIYTMLTGKQVKTSNEQTVIDNNNDIDISASDAAKSEKDLAKGINKAGKAAKNALMPFDELNTLQSTLGSGGLKNIGSELNSVNTNLETNKVTESIADGIRKTKDESDEFYIWFINRWNKLKEKLSIPIYVPAPVFAIIPNPIYNPNWGLELPPIQKPIFQPIPSPIYNPNWGLKLPIIEEPQFQPISNPIYNPNWNLIPPLVPVVRIPPINQEEYSLSLEELNLRTTESLKLLVENVLEKVSELKQKTLSTFGKIKTKTSTEMENISTGISSVLSTMKTNFETHRKNVTTTATAIASNVVTNINAGLSTMGTNINTALETIQTNMNSFGINIGTTAAAISSALVLNLNEGYKVVYKNFTNFAQAMGKGFVNFGSGILRSSAETAKGFVGNMVSGFITVWNNFKNLMKSIGEKISGWFKENKEVIVKTAIVGGTVALGVGALALAGPTAIPFIGAAAKNLAIPALAKGGITDGPMYALIGDNPGGKEVVSPLDDLTDIIASAVGTAVMSAIQLGDNSSNNAGKNKEVIIELDGTKLGRVILPKLNQEAGRLGYKSILQT